MDNGVAIEGEPKEGKINIIAERDGLLKVDKNTLTQFNMLGDVMCATLHSNTVVRKGQIVGGTRAIPLVVKKSIVEEAVEIANRVKSQDKNPPHSPFNKGGGKGIPPIPVLGIPACGMYHKTTIFDLILPRALAGETIGRKELAELGHGGLCLNCKKCAYPVCPFGK
ncbi:MAG: hypothetical protein Q8N12_07795 [Thermodesulfovibrionales bacterium]|nr:hypothetical protein [Thermodesulfovibrionales bacterium]